MSDKRPIRADLGRPETPAETAERKAEASRLHRSRQTVRNLLASLLVCGLAVLVMVLIVPRSDSPRVFDVDYRAVATEAQPGFTQQLATPEVPDSWRSNAAEIRTGADKVTEWYTGFVIYDGDQSTGFVGMSQGLNANDTWALQKLAGRNQTGEITIGGVQWREFDATHLTPENAGNTRYSLIGEVDGSLFVLYGSHEPEQVRLLAERIAADS
ncbi:DUF4245 family protein [uncultured Gulosibacter sp.]|uniref:DUF4245 family protein n=1 Tax=uncultured Gulosibacter sp. TaxID=1339167 RepID=UPI00288ABE56|nr:DUF4245 family protein [uncultured Gulosibacter sp.]